MLTPKYANITIELMHTQAQVKECIGTLVFDIWLVSCFALLCFTCSVVCFCFSALGIYIQTA